MTPATTAAPTLTTWSIDNAHSQVGFAVKHLMISTVRGRFGAVSGTVEFPEGTYDDARADVTIDAASIDTREEKRDAHLRSADFFDVETFPTLTFKSRRVQAVTATAEAAGETFQLVGDLTIKGITREVVLDVEVEGFQKDPWGNRKAGFSATTKVNRKDFGLTWNQALETGGLLVGDEIRISLDVQLQQA
jgi:polyisoprenoid-binding protein YceI